MSTPYIIENGEPVEAQRGDVPTHHLAAIATPVGRVPWARRNTAWTLGLIGYIAEATEDITRGKATWAEVVDHFTDDRHEWRTVEKAIYDLLAFGVVHRIGKAGDRRRPDTRALVITTLGRAWLDGDIIPIPTIDTED